MNIDVKAVVAQGRAIIRNVQGLSNADLGALDALCQIAEQAEQASGSTGAPNDQPIPNEAYNEGLEWAAQWITNTPTMPESREREFAINLATSIYAARRGIRYHIDGDCLLRGAVVCPEIDLITASAAEAREEAERRWIELGYTVRECVVRSGPLAQLGAGSTGAPT